MLKNGYYLSAYISISEISFLFDFSLRGDQNISLWKVEDKNVTLVHYWELERISGLKGHDRSFVDTQTAVIVLNELLGQYNLTLDDMEEVWGVPILDTSDDYHSLNDYSHISYHAIAHIYSALSFDMTACKNEPSLIIAVDGGPDSCVDYNKDEKPYYAGAYIDDQENIKVFPVISPGPLWAAAKNIFKLREGTLMALGSATACEFDGHPFKSGRAFDIESASNVVLELRAYCDDIKVIWDANEINFVKGKDNRFSDKENYISAIVKEIDKCSKNIMCELIEDAIRRFSIIPGETNFAVTGGYGLNCPANTFFMKKYGFKEYIAPPCVNDSGLSLGIALYAFRKKIGKFNFELKNAFYGDKDNMTVDEMEASYHGYIKRITKYRFDKVVEDIEESPVIWFQGAAEIGPRALGHRSILGNPFNVKTKEILNDIKKRQWWRPVAPIMLEDAVSEWFEDGYRSPYMLHAFHLREEKRGILPAIEHLDGSCRIQTINESGDPILYKLLKEMQRIKQVPIICNTSLNDKGEPIINTVDEAINFALRKKIKIAYINNYRVELCNHEKYAKQVCEVRKFRHLFEWDEDKLAERLSEANPYNLSKEDIAVYLYSGDVRERFDLKRQKDVRIIKILTKQAKKKHPDIAYGGVNTGCR